DTHIRTGSKVEASQTSVEMLHKVLDAERPDLVIFTGDVVSDKPYKAGLEMILAPVLEREIPWVLLFGNHDEEQDLTRQQMLDLLQNYPCYAGARKEIKGVKGHGNHILEIKDQGNKKVMALLYCMDSHAYSQMKPAVEGYDWFSFDQIQWYRKASAKYTAGNKGIPLPALAFFHIPFPEYSMSYTDPTIKIIGNKREKKSYPADVNPGMFVAMLESGDVMGTFVGHDHVNDYLFNHHGIALVYGRFSGSNTTYNHGIGNGVRVIELTEGERGFHTWIRLSDETVELAVKFPDDLPLPEKKK
ncbi:MAG: metallophosphoesterase family protein, partial [Odoribacteraceae bacterium]|nr:metallophosphoesterase family protein [Odoribacteraceae bacterium]